MTKSRKHPPGLYVLFFTEMWERFSYYGLRSLLVYYMIRHLHLTQERTSAIYGLYTGFVYFTPLFGGLLADRFLGQRRTVILGIGCILLAAAFLVLIPPAREPAVHPKAGLWWLTACTFVLTLGEIHLSPIGLSLVTKIAPARVMSMMMGVWFLSSFFGNYLSGYLGTFWEKMPREHFFLPMFGLSFAAGTGFFALLKPLKKAIQGTAG